MQTKSRFISGVSLNTDRARINNFIGNWSMSSEAYHCQNYSSLFCNDGIRCSREESIKLSSIVGFLVLLLHFHLESAGMLKWFWWRPLQSLLPHVPWTDHCHLFRVPPIHKSNATYQNRFIQFTCSSHINSSSIFLLSTAASHSCSS